MDVLVSMLLPVIAVAAGRYLYEGIQIVSRFVDSNVPAPVHAIVLVVVQFTLIQLAQLLGMPLPEALDAFTLEIVTAVVTALMAMGWHAISNKQSVARLRAI